MKRTTVITLPSSPSISHPIAAAKTSEDEAIPNRQMKSRISNLDAYKHSNHKRGRGWRERTGVMSPVTVILVCTLVGGGFDCYALICYPLTGWVMSPVRVWLLIECHSQHSLCNPGSRIPPPENHGTWKLDT
ncbi:hypothetical protein K474DRAFT_84468 [Panus rudis PR-1116 ss-1]|nr:hypothetical protein K474DRAFT_84468 [Panus rudis PR-1116 ss-1]